MNYVAGVPNNVCTNTNIPIPSCPLGPPYFVMTGVDAAGNPNCVAMTPPKPPAQPPTCVLPTDPTCRPWFCQQNPGSALCPLPGPAALGGPGVGDGGCDGGGGC